MPGIEACFKIVRPCGEPSVACGVVERGFVFGQSLVAGHAENHILVAVALHLGGERLVEGLALLEQAEALGLGGEVLLLEKLQLLEVGSDGVAQRSFFGCLANQSNESSLELDDVRHPPFLSF